MKKYTCLLIAMLISSGTLFAQVGINNDNSAPDGSAMLDVKSTTDGFLPPRMTQSQISAILSPANGLFVYCTSDNKYYSYNSSTTTWKEISFGSGTTFSCPSITVNHVAGDVAPVTKTVTYYSVGYIPGEPTKCWITSNLGADHQAGSVDDATEASAGWYWQFKRKQGYKHDGSTRTPNTTWIYPINESSNWTAAYDPCTLELGSGWRIPTSTEWTNVDASGGWTDWNGPWNSGLKMHAAGYLFFTNGSLTLRGQYGFYSSSTQQSLTHCMYLIFNSSFSAVTSTYKATGFSLRCLKVM